MIRVENANDRFNIVITNLSWEAAEYLRAVLINAPDESNLALLEAMGVSIPECEVCENPAACEKPE
ncbi:MAG: hypothetical protein KI788_06330, partial [Mameliella sp.]|nr:hypothetical protein [Mameliella sp.]